MISKLVFATYITSKVAFFLQPSITLPYHICHNKWYSFLGLFYNISYPMYIYYNKEDHMLSKTILRCLEVVEVAHRGSTAGGRVIRLRVRLSKRVLGIYLRNSLNLLWVFFFCCRLGWNNWGYWLLMEHTNMVHSITQLHLELVNLFLKESNHRVALHYLSTMLQNLKLVLLLALLKYPFYPLFILDNGMNLISKSLTVLTPGLIIGHFHTCTYILEELRFCRFL